MFTEFKKGRWSYMLMAAMASIALAALTSLFSTRAYVQTDSQSGDNQEQVITGRHAIYNESTVRFIN